jgi:TetR/AcrR family fatty acid metabolism transcriptional regulator
MKDKTMKDAIQELLITARRSQILEAAAKVFAEKGFHPTTIKDIAREAGIAEGTIYNYFESKTALLLGIFDRMSEAVRQDTDFSKITPGDFRSFMKAYFRQPLIALKSDSFELFRIIVSEIMVNQELRALYYQKMLEPTLAMGETIFQQWIDQQVIKPVNLKLTMRAISGMIMGLIVEYVMGDKTLEAQWEELPDFLTDLMLDGIINEK